jgi:hypothetical protein
MTTRARWRTPGTEIPGGDLLDGVPPPSTPASVGVPIGLRGKSDEEEMAEITGLMNREDELASAGVTCRIKDSYDSCCLACPLSQHTNPQDTLSALCRLGREQDRVLTESVARAEMKRRAADSAAA